MKKHNDLRRGFSLIKTVVSTTLQIGVDKFRKTKSDKNNFVSKSAKKLVEGLDDLKGISMKLGQILSMLDESLLPSGWKEQLAKLQHEAKARPWSEIEPILISEYGTLNVFRSIETEPIHAASIAQVHKAVLKTGEVVAVKVRYPNIENYVGDDVKNLKRLIKFLGLFPNFENYDHVLHSAHEMFMNEVDLLKEMEHYVEYKNQLQHIENIYIPSVHKEYCTHKILVTDWVEGLSIRKWIEQHNKKFSENTKEENKISDLLLEIVLYELYIMNFIQSDPNPANFIITTDEKLALVDFGAAFKLSPKIVDHYYQLHFAIKTNDRERVLNYGYELGFINKSDPEKCIDLFYEIILMTFEPFLLDSFDWSLSKMSKRLNSITLEFAKLTNFRMPAGEILFLNRRLSGNMLLLESIQGTCYPKRVVEKIIKIKEN